MIAADIYSIANLMHQPESATASGRIWGRPDLTRERIADLALVFHLANDLITGYPRRDGTRPTGMSQRIGGQLGDGDD